LGGLDLIIVFGSGNDINASQSALTAAANTYWNALAAARPGVPIVVLGIEPGTLTGFPPAQNATVNGWLKSAAESNVNVSAFVDMINTRQPWVTGTGNSASPNGTGNQDLFVGSDGIHPTIEGYRNLAERAAQALRSVTIAAPSYM